MRLNTTRKHGITFLHSLLVLLLLCVFFLPVHASDSMGFSPEVLYTYGDPQNLNTRVGAQDVDGEWYLILPATSESTRVCLFAEDFEGTLTAKGSKGTATFLSGEAIDLDSICEAGAYTITLQAEGNAAKFQVTILFSENIAAMYLVSDDPINNGRAWVEREYDKSNKATGSMVLQNGDGSLVYDGTLTQIKGRGNSTWDAPKKPYQIKLKEKTDLLETGNSDNASKTWVLLANYYDASLMRNTLALGIGQALEMQVAVENRFVDLYYDGEYRGTYLLSEKVEVGSGRVDITDLEEKNEESNAGIDLEELAVETGVTANGATYTYCSGMNSPADITGGFLLEMDFEVRAVEEVCYFYTTRKNYVVVKSPEFANREEMDYIATWYQEYEDAVYNGGIHPENGKSVAEYMDLDSMAKYYLISELAKNRDAFKSSTYIYKEAGEDTMIASPLWDFDLTFGSGGGLDLSEDVSPNGILVGNYEFVSMLCKNEEFFERVKTLWNQELKPMLQTTVLGDKNSVTGDGSLRSLVWYEKEIAASAACNEVLWPDSHRSWKVSVDYLTDYITARIGNLDSILEVWTSHSSAPNGNFLDVPQDAWYYAEVHKARSYGLVNGTGGDSYDPLSVATRAQVIQVLYNMNDRPGVTYDGRFSDVSEIDWYADAISWGAQEGIVKGYDDGSICGPTDAITRQDLVVLLYRYSGSPKQEGDSLTAFQDAATVSDYAKEAVQWAVAEGIIKGSDDGYIMPLASASRAEMAAILVRFHQGQQ